MAKDVVLGKKTSEFFPKVLCPKEKKVETLRS